MRVDSRALLMSLCAAPTFLTGCNPGFDPVSYLSGLRLMVVKAEPAQASGGDPITLTALAIDTDKQPISYTWSLCHLGTALASGSTVNQDCVPAAMPDGGNPLTQIGTGSPLAYTLPGLNLNSLGVPDETLGVYLPITLAVTAPGVPAGTATREVDGIYKMRITYPSCTIATTNGATESPINHNPTLAGVWVVPASGGSTFTTTPVIDDDSDGAATDISDAGIPHADAAIPQAAIELTEANPLEIHSGETWSLRALFTDDSFEHYCGVNYIGSPPISDKTETLSVRWFTTAGKFDNEVTGQESATNLSMTDKIPTQSGTLIDLYAIGRDDRGGSTWMHRTLIYR